MPNVGGREREVHDLASNTTSWALGTEEYDLAGDRILTPLKTWILEQGRAHPAEIVVSVEGMTPQCLPSPVDRRHPALPV